MIFTNLLKRNNVFALVFCVVLSLLLWSPRLLTSLSAAGAVQYPQATVPSLWVDAMPNDILSTMLAFLFTFTGAGLLLFLNNRHMFHSTDEYLLPLLYVLIASAIPSTQWFSGIQVALIFVCMGFNYLLFSHYRTPGLAELFTATFVFSMAALCYPPLLLLLPLIPIGVIILRPFAWRDWVVMPVAALLPFAYVYLYFWMTMPNHDATAALANFDIFLPHMPEQLPFDNTPVVAFVSVLALILLISIVGGFSRQIGTKVKILHVRTIFLWMLLLLLAGSIFYPDCNYQLMPLIALPVAVITANYMAQPHGRKIKTFCWLLLLSTIIYLQVAEFL